MRQLTLQINYALGVVGVATRTEGGWTVHTTNDEDIRTAPLTTAVGYFNSAEDAWAYGRDQYHMWLRRNRSIEDRKRVEREVRSR